MTKLGDWSNKAWIRLKNDKPSVQRETGYYFKPSLVPVSLHPRVIKAGHDVTEKLQILHLYHYLDGVDTLETEIINRSLQNIFRGVIDLEIPEELKEDAYKIYIDEGFHAFMSYELKNKIVQQTRVQYTRKPNLLKTVDLIEKQMMQVSPALRNLVQFLASATNETLISANLLQCKDKDLRSSVSSYLSSHLKDEAKHHLYFASLFQVIWKQFSLHEKKTLGVILPRLIKILLSVNKENICSDLVEVGFSKKEADLIFSESYDKVPMDMIESAAKPALTLFNKCHVFDVKEVRDSFLEEGFRLQSV